MQLFLNDKIESNNGENTLILYLNPSLTLVEFANEFGYAKSDKRNNLDKSAKEYANSKYPNLKINAIKIMLGCMLITSVGASQNNGEVYAHNVTSSTRINIVINNKPYTFSQAPMIADGITYVPIRQLVESLGGSVWWNSQSQTVGINKDNISIAFVVGSRSARINGVLTDMPRSFIHNGTTMVPLRFISEHLDFNVSWNNATSTISITTKAQTNSQYHTVQSGDTLWRLSQRYNTSIDSIRSLNNLNSDVLIIGQTLLIPNSNQSNNTSNNENIPSEYYSYDIPPGYTVNDLYWLSRIVHAESESEPYEGKLAVANVILNRVRSDGFPNNIKSVIFDTAGGIQFQPIGNGTIYNNPNSESIRAALDALRGNNNIDNALFFLNPARATSFWIVNNRQFYMRIANHDFYL
ncbi:stalk domain-containing protein [Alkalithermobacter paradoxus]|uniref:Spore cortex-lytic enzyme n=1 Tax=Alkalithermobacter paradoxus TaxID=29349 RepID=A0A1V4I8T2_9FIRM|nr:spore cortex-lytic enzyme precursor [[Clostridium] thermoalcaliphilum]